jgi:hypothetical protein
MCLPLFLIHMKSPPLWHVPIHLTTDEDHYLQPKTAEALAREFLLCWKPVQWGSIADQPDMPERIDEPALAMDAPGCLVILKIVQAAGGACLQSTCDHRAGFLTMDPPRRIKFEVDPGSNHSGNVSP